MKKIFCLLLTIVMLVSLCACGMNKKEMLSNAIELDWDKVHDEYLANATRAESNYDGKIVKWTGTVYRIEHNWADMANETHNGFPLNPISVYLSEDELIKLDKYQEITVVGKLDIGPFPKITDAFIVE